MHQMSELRVGFLFGGLVDHHSRPRCIFERGGQFSVGELDKPW